MDNKTCLDSDFLIDFLKNKEEAVNWIKENSDFELATTIINTFELYYGEYKNKISNDTSELDNFLSHLTILNLNQEIAKKVGENMVIIEKEGKTLQFRDILIGTIAANNGYAIKTNNKKHFERIPELKII